jgi:RNA ligase (TIGR02306 family)
MNEVERKLVTIRQVVELKPIENADAIELAIVDGWQCVVKKGEFKECDVGVYFEIDSFLPLEERYAFLKHVKTHVDGSKGYRLKTAKFRGALSQGLLLPFSLFPEIDTSIHDDRSLEEILNIKKYEIPIPAHLAGTVKGAFPAAIHKTDQERIQNLPEYFTKYKDNKFEVTEKIDGTSCTYYINNGEFGVCSRNLELKDTEDNTYWQIARELDIENKLRSKNVNIALQGEIAGDGVQGNPIGLKGKHFFVFDIWDINEGHYLTTLGCRSLTKAMGLEHVPVVEEEMKVFEKYDNITSLLKFAMGKSSLNAKNEREGLVFKGDDGVSFKVVSNDYLLKEKD